MPLSSLGGVSLPEQRADNHARGAVRERQPILVDHDPAPLYRRPGPIRRVLAALASGGLAIVTGAVAATVLAFGVAWTVVRLTSLLKR